MGNDSSDLKQWSEIIAFSKSIKDSTERKSIEFRKGALEISKIIITNLHLLNAGGIVALPAVSSIYGFANLEAKARFYITAVPFGAYTLGLVLAACCALGTYFNYLRWAEFYEIEEEEALLRFEPALPNANTAERAKYRSERLSTIPQDMKRKLKSINLTFALAHIFGWFSVVSFLSGTGYLVYHAFSLAG